MKIDKLSELYKVYRGCKSGRLKKTGATEFVQAMNLALNNLLKKNKAGETEMMYLVYTNSGWFQTTDDPYTTYKENFLEGGWSAIRFDIVNGHTQYYVFMTNAGDSYWEQIGEQNIPR